jgi:hypothetical protein
MANAWERYQEYRKERQYIREALKLDNQNFW